MTSPGQMQVKIKTTERDIRLACSVSTQDIATFLKLDTDNNNRLSEKELDAGRETIERYLSRQLIVSNEGEICPVLKEEMLWGEGRQRVLYYQTRRCKLPFGLLQIENRILFDDQGGHRHFTRIQIDEAIRSTILSNFFPTYSVKIAQAATSQPSTTSASKPKTPLPKGGWLLVHYLWEGIWHIWIGFDHILFLIALLFVAASLRHLIWIVTAFTLGHSVTLILSALEIVVVPARPVEVIIALSIGVIAVENIWRQAPSLEKRAWVTALFGLVHGFGFSSVLRENVGLPTESLLPALLSFNLGVEIGQLAIVIVAFPLLQRILQSPQGRRTQIFCNALILALALYWSVIRALGIDG